MRDFFEHKPGELTPTAYSDDFFKVLLPKLYEKNKSRVNFAMGNPAFQQMPSLSAHVAHAVLDRSNAIYRNEKGDRATLEAVASYFRCKGVKEADIDTVMPGYGVTHLYSMVLRLLYAKAKEEYPDKKPVFLMTAPSYGLFGEQPEFSGFDIEVIPLRKENGMRLDANELDHVIDTINNGSGNRRVAVKYNINPHNPLGTVSTIEEMEATTSVYCKHGVMVVDDMIYAGLEHKDLTALPLASMDNMFDRTITMVGISKSFCSASLRSAAVCANKDIIESLQKEVRRTVQSISILSQSALIPTFSQEIDSDDRDDYLKRNSSKYIERAMLMRALINGISSVGFAEEKLLAKIADTTMGMFGGPKSREILSNGLPEVEILNEDVESGFFYVIDFSKIKGRSIGGVQINDSMTLADKLITNSKLLVLPSRCMLSDDYHPMIARITFGYNDQQIARGVRHLYEFLEKLDN